MPNVSSLPCSPTVRNLQWAICTYQWYSPARLNKINNENSPECSICKDFATTFHVYYSCPITWFLLKITRLLIRVFSGPLLELNPRNFFLAHPPKNKVTNYKLMCAAISNTHEFRRFLQWNPPLGFSKTLLLSLFQNHHRSHQKVCARSGLLQYPSFLLEGDLNSLRCEFPSFISSPILPSPEFMKSHNQVLNAKMLELD